jgi:transcription elongation factor Elf1
MKKRLKIECPECGDKLGVFGLCDLPKDFKEKVYTVDCDNCGWTRVLSMEGIQDALNNSEPPKGMFKAYWEKK